MTEKSFSNSDDIFFRVRENYKRISENIDEAMNKAGRKDRVRLMAVTKTVPFENVNYAVSLGIDLLGENRVQEFLGKYEFYDSKSQIHFIGGLQSNKVKYIIDKVSMIHSVDSVKLADEINKRAALCGKITDILIEVNVGGEKSKGGVAPDQIDEFSCYCKELSNIRLRGFMAIPPIDINGSNNKYFEQMERIYNDCRSKSGKNIDTLSMGMSNDYQQALRYGSNIVRIGSALFGRRK